MKNLKKITKEDVLETSLELLKNNSTINNLMIKNELRNKNFFAVQSEVSSFMNEILNDQDNNLSFTDNGVYKEYSFKSSFISPLTVSTIPNNFVTKKSKGKKPMLPQLEIPVKGCWQVFISKKSFSSLNILPVYYDSKYTRDEVRCDFAKLMKENHHDVRARKYS